MNDLASKKFMLSKEISQSLKEMVIAGQLNPGDKLPNEMDLASEMGVSRSTVREAVKELVAANVLEIVRGKGTFVSKHPGWKHDPLGVEFMAKSDLLLMLFETRLLVEPGVASLAAERASATDLDKIRDNIDKMKSMVKKHADYSKEDLEFHRMIAKATKNPIIQRIVPIVNESITYGYKETVHVPGSISKALDSHEKIFKAIVEKDSKTAELEMRKHLTVTVDDIRLQKLQNLK